MAVGFIADEAIKLEGRATPGEVVPLPSPALSSTSDL